MRRRFIIVIGIIEAMEAWFIIFSFMLLMAGYQDSKTRKVSDKLSAGMWCVCAVYCTLNPALFSVPVLVFAALYQYNALAYPISPKYGFGWADILIIPVYATFIYGFGGIIAVGVGMFIASIATLFYLFLFKKSAPYVMALAVSFIGTLVLLPYL